MGSQVRTLQRAPALILKGLRETNQPVSLIWERFRQILYWILSFQIPETSGSNDPEINRIGKSAGLKEGLPSSHALRVLGDSQINRQLHQHLDRWQAAPENELAQRIYTVLLEQPTDQGIHERTVRAANSGEIQNHLFAVRQVQVGIDFGHAETMRL
jgi:hypothetical protein